MDVKHDDVRIGEYWSIVYRGKGERTMPEESMNIIVCRHREVDERVPLIRAYRVLDRPFDFTC